MKNVLKRTVAILLVFTLMFSFTSCSKDDFESEGSIVAYGETEYGNEIASLMSEMENGATEIIVKNIMMTDNDNQFKVTAVKSKNAIVASLAYLPTIILLAFGYLYTPGAYYSYATNCKYVDIKIKYTNNSDENQLIGDVFTSCLACANGNYYNATIVAEKSAGLELSDETTSLTVKPGRTKTIHIFLEIPEEYLSNVEIVFDVDGTYYTYDFISKNI